MPEKPILVNQKDWKPTRKQFMGAIGGIVTAGVLNVVSALTEKYPSAEFLSGPEVLTGIPIIVYFGVAYIMRDAAN